MSFLRKNIALVKEEFEKKRASRESAREARIKELHIKLPELEEIDFQLSRVGVEIMACAMQGRDGLEKRINALKENNLALQKRRAELLLKNGYPADYTDIKYDCNICQDYGSFDGKMCSCYRRALVEKQIESSGIGALLKTQGFDTFSLEYYENKEEMEALLSYLQEYINGFATTSENLLFVGGTGLGKTHLTTSIARELIEKGFNVVYESAQNIFFDFDKDRFRDRFDENVEMLSDKYFEAELLIIDDLGVELPTPFSKSCLYNIINTRINKGLPIIASTNLTGAELQKMYDDRITSRLIGSFTIKKFVGKDIRRAK